jgi:hypothetical protein
MAPPEHCGGHTKTRAEAEQAAQTAEQELAADRGVPRLPEQTPPSPRSQSMDRTTEEAAGLAVERAPIEQLLSQVTAWAHQRPDIRGVALVGSWARGAVRPDSDVDLVVLTTCPDRYLTQDDWPAALGATQILRTQAWGKLTERRLLLPGDLELEVGLVRPAWAATDPVDPGTPRVVADGMRILHDPDRKLAALAKTCQPTGGSP